MSALGFGPLGYIGSDSGGGGGGVASPTITIVSPAEGSLLSRATPIVFTVVAAASVALRRVVVSVLRGGDIIEELIHDGISFTAPYTGGSNVRSSITDGYQFTVLRIGGWRGSSITLRVVAVDVFGNLAQKTVGVPHSLYTWPVAAGDL